LDRSKPPAPDSSLGKETPADRCGGFAFGSLRHGGQTPPQLRSACREKNPSGSLRLVRKNPHPGNARRSATKITRRPSSTVGEKMLPADVRTPRHRQAVRPVGCPTPRPLSPFWAPGLARICLSTSFLTYVSGGPGRRVERGGRVRRG
jgi:hypothetical protein